MSRIALIVAMDRHRGIGKNNDLMWNLPEDMQFFKRMTKDQIVVMGRKNYDSIPERFRPLPNRLNCVLTQSKDFIAPDCLVFHELSTCIAHFHGDARQIFIIGGGEIYRLAMETLSIDDMYITEVDGEFGADTFFPEFDASPWHVACIQEQKPDERHSHGFAIYHYTRKKEVYLS
jgi:dihydrofolate reductase